MATCNPLCITFCQDMRNYQHAAGCANEGRSPFARIEYDGSSMITRPWDVEDIIGGVDRGQYSVTTVWMTEAEFDALPESAGF